MKQKTVMCTFLVWACFLYTCTAQWTQIGTDIDGIEENDLLGRSVSLNADGTILAIGSSEGVGIRSAGSVRVYQNVNNSWMPLGAEIIGENSGDKFGRAVSLNNSGNILAVGAFLNNGNGLRAGHVRVFRYANNVWTQIGTDIDGKGPLNDFGRSVHLNADGTIVVAGAPFSNEGGNGFRYGQVRIFENINDVWTQVGGDINGESDEDQSGASVSINDTGNIVAIGAIANDGNGPDAGHVRVFENVNNVWTQIGSDIDGEAALDGSGGAVSLNGDGTIVAIGASSNDGNGDAAGHVRMYQNINNNWTQIGNDIDGENSADFSGTSVSLNANGNIVAIGAYGNDDNGNFAGHARVYEFNNSVWTQVGLDIDGEAASDQSGQAVSISNDGAVIAIGAIGNDNLNGMSAGHVRVYNNSSVLSTQTNLLQSNVFIYPNPSYGASKIQLGTNPQTGSIRIYNLLGQKMDTFTFIHKNSVELNTKTYEAGVYFVKITFSSYEITKQFVVKP
ncbi:MAG: T9SS type A sorting domain-containing protein [Bacteroidota bacterium]